MTSHIHFILTGKFPSVGQNLGMGYSSWNKTIYGWYDEVKDFSYKSQTQRGVVGHYTQVFALLL